MYSKKNNTIDNNVSSKLPRITIVTAVYNAAPFIESCISSVINQEYPNLEYIVIDGGSIDGTLDIIKKYSDRITYWESKKDNGQTHALNKGYAKASGNIYGWLNADEEYLPGTLLRIAKLFLHNTNLDLVFGYRQVCDENGNSYELKRYPAMHPLGYMLYTARVLPSDATFWSKRMHQLTGELDEINFPQLAMDTDWFLRLSIHVKNWKRLPLALSKFKEHGCRKTKVGMPELARAESFLRERFILQNQFSRRKLFLGWLLRGFIVRYYEKNLFRLPRWPVIWAKLGLRS